MEEKKNEIIEENVDETIEENVNDVIEENVDEKIKEKTTDQDEENNQEQMNGESEEKSGRYETLTELEPNLWTYGSPIVITSGVLTRDFVSKKNRLTFRFVNIFEQDIREVHLTVLVGEEEEPIEHSYLALGQKYLSEKGRAAQITIPDEEARTFKIVIDQVLFEDGTEWHKKEALLESAGEMDDIETFAQAKLKDYEDNYLTATEEIAKDDSESIGNGIEILKRIRWYKDGRELYKDAKRKYGILKQNEERKLVGASKKADREQAMKKRTVEVAVAIGIIILIAVVVVIAYIIPNNKLNKAKKTFKAEKYSEAAEQLEALNGFKDSESYLSASYYNLGKQAYEKGDTKTAKSYFEKSYSTDKDCNEGVQAKAFLDYYDGVDAMEKGDYKNAQELLQGSKDSIGDVTLLNDIDTRISELYYLQEDYESAWNSIINIYAKDTKNEEISSMYCTYGEAYAKKLIAEGKRKEGMDVYGKVKDNKQYKGDVLTKKFYDEAVKLAKKGKIDDAEEKGGNSDYFGFLNEIESHIIS